MEFKLEIAIVSSITFDWWIWWIKLYVSINKYLRLLMRLKRWANELNETFSWTQQINMHVEIYFFTWVKLKKERREKYTDEMTKRSKERKKAFYSHSPHLRIFILLNGYVHFSSLLLGVAQFWDSFLFFSFFLHILILFHVCKSTDLFLLSFNKLCVKAS